MQFGIVHLQLLSQRGHLFTSLFAACTDTEIRVPNAELSRPPKGDRFELLVLPERSEGKEFDTAQLRIPPERSEGGTPCITGRRCAKRGGNPTAVLLGAPVHADVMRHLLV